MNLNKKTKQELIDDINRLTENLVLKNRTIESFKNYNVVRKREFTDMQIKLARVIEQRNDFDRKNSELERKVDELKGEINRLSNTNIKLNEEVEELLLQVYGEEYDSDDIKFDSKLRTRIIKPVDQCVELRNKITELEKALKGSAGEYYLNEMNILKSEITELERKRKVDYKTMCDLRSIINASTEATKIEGCIKNAIANLERELQKRKNEIETLKSQIRNLTGINPTESAESVG